MVKHGAIVILFRKSCKKKLNHFLIFNINQRAPCNNSVLWSIVRYNTSSKPKTWSDNHKIFKKTVFLGWQGDKREKCATNFRFRVNAINIRKRSNDINDSDSFGYGSVLCRVFDAQNDRAWNNSSNSNIILFQNDSFINFHIASSIDE